MIWQGPVDKTSRSFGGGGAEKFVLLRSSEKIVVGVESSRRNSFDGRPDNRGCCDALKDL